MALIPCPECGHNISSLARFCPKCTGANAQKAAQSAGNNTSRSDVPENAAAQENLYPSDTGSCTELHQSEFKPSLNEKIILEGRTFLINGFMKILDGYAYLTSKRYVLCDDSMVNIVYQIGINGIASVEEGRHLLTKKIIITTISGETLQVKSQPHAEWFSALDDPQKYVGALSKPKVDPSNGTAGALDWYYVADGINIGPVKENIIVQFIQNNHTIFRDTNVWNSSLSEWKRAEDTILTIYFSESALSDADAVKATLFSRISRHCFLPQLQLLYRKYF